MTIKSLEAPLLKKLRSLAKKKTLSNKEIELSYYSLKSLELLNKLSGGKTNE